MRSKWKTPAATPNPSAFEAANQAVPETGVIMNVRKLSINKEPAEPACREETILSGGRNLSLETTGPPKKDSMKLGT